MEHFKVQYVFPDDYKSSIKILYLNSYSNHNLIIFLSFCLLWIGTFFIIYDLVVYGLLLVAISLLSFFNGYRNLKISTKSFIKRHQFYHEYSSGRTVVFSNYIYINDSVNDKIKEYTYSDIEALVENEELFIIKLKFKAYIPIYKNNFIIGKSDELKDFLIQKNHTVKHINTKGMISNGAIWAAIALIISTIIFLMI